MVRMMKARASESRISELILVVACLLRRVVLEYGIRKDSLPRKDVPKELLCCM